MPEVKKEEVKNSSFEKFLLPSKGKLYPTDWTDAGKIGLRPMTISEEMILTTARHIKKGIALDMIFSACLENNKIDTKELLSGDRSFILYNLRCMSYGAAYDYEVKCPSCGHKIKDTYNLNEMNVKYIEDGITEPYAYKLPISGKNVSFRFMRGKDELKLVQNREYRLATFGADQTDNTILERFSLVVDSYDNKPDKIEVERALKTMIAGDASALRDKMIEVEPGINTEARVACPACGDESVIDIPMGISFFSRSKTKNA